MRGRADFAGSSGRHGSERPDHRLETDAARRSDDSGRTTEHIVSHRVVPSDIDEQPLITASIPGAARTTSLPIFGIRPDRVRFAGNRRGQGTGSMRKSS